MNEQEWRDELTSWLEGFSWKWFCSLTFRPGLSESHARWCLRRWIDELRAAMDAVMVRVKSGLPATALVGEIEICAAAETGIDLYPELHPAR